MALPRPLLERTAEVAVIGAGTGGALAAIAAGRQGARTLVIDPVSFAGGIGTGGGIHSYYWGFPGGLQDEVDERVAAINDLFAPKGTSGGFHPEAKKIVLHEMMDAAGVEFRGGSFATGATVSAGRIDRVEVASTRGPWTIRAACWVDATGDGDLAAQAGASFRFGRVGDGILHAYSQSCSYTSEVDGELRRPGVNFDAGYVDPTDSEDLTRARVAGIHQYFVLPFEAARRPNGMSPLLGLRQGRQIETDYVLTLDDLIERRQFPDAVGLTGSAYDNHAVDYEFESIDTMFLVWGCQLYYISTSCQIPYRMLLPRGLDNLWLGSRSLGVTEEAHHSMRMERDIQRVGEAAGVAAAMAAGLGCGSREVPYGALRQALERTGSFKVKDKPGNLFGNEMGAPDLAVAMAGTPSEARLEQCVEDIASGRGSLAAFKNYGAPCSAPRSGSPCGSSTATAVIASATGWRPCWAPRTRTSRGGRLCCWPPGATRPPRRACRRPSGRTKRAPSSWPPSATSRSPTTSSRCPAGGWRRAFSATAAARMISRPSRASQSTPGLPLNARTVIALACERIVRRLPAVSPRARAAVERILGRIVGEPPALAVTSPNRNPYSGAEDFRKQETNRRVANRVEEDYSWQAVYTAARVAAAVGLPIPPQARQFLDDGRALVRRAFRGLKAPLEP